MAFVGQLPRRPWPSRSGRLGYGTPRYIGLWKVFHSGKALASALAAAAAQNNPGLPN